jgi:hypothetical protein
MFLLGFRRLTVFVPEIMQRSNRRIEVSKLDSVPHRRIGTSPMNGLTDSARVNRKV